MWRQFNEKYQISSEGEILNTKTNKLLGKDINSKGYYRVRLDGKRWFIHRLVAITFIDNPLNLPQVNHKDHNKLNNIYTNLEWCANRYNNQHSYLHGRISGRTRLSIDNVKEILNDKSNTPKELAVLYNVSVQTIYAVKHGLNMKRLNM